MAKAAQAAEAWSALRDCGGCVVELEGVKHSQHNGKDQLQLEENFTVTVVPEGHPDLRQQLLKCVALNAAAAQEHGAELI